MRIWFSPGVPRGAALTSKGIAFAAVIQVAVLDAMMYLRLVGRGQCLVVLAVGDVDVCIARSKITKRGE